MCVQPAREIKLYFSVVSAEIQTQMTEMQLFYSNRNDKAIKVFLFYL